MSSPGREELIRRLVLNQVSDDYENVDQIIFPNVAADGARLGLTLERSDVIKALDSLFRDGLAKPYLLSSREPFSTELETMPNVVEGDFDTWFYITQKGMEFHLSDDTWWPFEDD